MSSGVLNILCSLTLMWIPGISTSWRRPACVVASCYVDQTHNQGTAIFLRSAHTSAEYRAAAYLRAQSFYTYPNDRSEFARRAHLRMKADDMWEHLEKGTGQQGDDLSQPILLPIIAVTTSLNDAPVSSLLDDASVSLPTDGKPEFVIGTLDVNIGPKLPAEELIGRMPMGPDVGRLRAYLSNVCVLSAARRQGVASRLIEEAFRVSLARGVEHIYVHVVADNKPALLLYEAHSFAVEQEEEDSFARALNRPRRLLLHRSLR